MSGSPHPTFFFDFYFSLITILAPSSSEQKNLHGISSLPHFSRFPSLGLPRLGKSG